MNRTYKLTILTFLLGFAWVFQSCPARSSVEIPARNVSIQVEVARTPDEHSRGLMKRKSLAKMAGMLFVFAQDTDHIFWMKDTWISLDLIFIDQHLQIVGLLEKVEPNTLTPRSVGVLSRYVLEVNGGFCHQFGVKTGDKVAIKIFSD